MIVCFLGGNLGTLIVDVLIVEKDGRKNIYEEIRICTEGNYAGVVRVERSNCFTP